MFPQTLQQIGIIERMNQTSLDIVKSMKEHANLIISF